MTKTEAIIRSILGPVRLDIRPLAQAVDLASELLFIQKIAMDDIRVTKDIYPVVAKQLKKKTGAVSRKVERLANLCWDSLTPERKKEIIGEQRHDIRTPSEMVFYLAFYAHFGKPFFEVISREPSLLF